MACQIEALPLLPQALGPRQVLELEARRRGFQELGVTDLAPFREAGARARRALRQGRLQGMPWFHQRRVEQATELGARFPWARSLVALTYPYRPLPEPPPPAPGPRGRIAAYAQGEDYHARLEGQLRDLARALEGRFPGLRWHQLVDHGRAFDRAIAERAGVGFCGKHTQLISRGAGSYVLLGSLLLSLELAPDRPSRRGCGRCRSCLSACPTGALLAPGVIDARRCISYLTIEHEGPIAPELRRALGSWVFGCDICQQACPINERLAPPPLAPGPASSAAGPVPFPDLLELLALTEEEFQRRFHHTTMRRSGRERLARNAALALGNSGDPSAVAGLERALGGDPSATVRGACAWALGRLGGGAALRALLRARRREADPSARAEIEAALPEAAGAAR